MILDQEGPRVRWDREDCLGFLARTGNRVKMENQAQPDRLAHQEKEDCLECLGCLGLKGIADFLDLMEQKEALADLAKRAKLVLRDQWDLQVQWDLLVQGVREAEKVLQVLQALGALMASLVLLVHLEPLGNQARLVFPEHQALKVTWELSVLKEVQVYKDQEVRECVVPLAALHNDSLT